MDEKVKRKQPTTGKRKPAKSYKLISRACLPYDHYDTAYLGVSIETRIMCEEYKIMNTTNLKANTYAKLFVYTFNLRPTDGKFNVPISRSDMERAFLYFLNKRNPAMVPLYKRHAFFLMLGLNGIRKVRLDNQFENVYLYLCNPLNTLSPLIEEINNATKP